MINYLNCDRMRLLIAESYSSFSLCRACAIHIYKDTSARLLVSSPNEVQRAFEREACFLQFGRFVLIWRSSSLVAPSAAGGGAAYVAPFSPRFGDLRPYRIGISRTTDRENIKNLDRRTVQQTKSGQSRTAFAREPQH
jgi:hypothetical protein